MSATRAKNWCFTVNNYTQDQVHQLRDLWNPDGESKIRYVCWGYEVAPATGTKHLQGYVSFKNQLRFNAARSLLPSGAHIEKAKGNPKQNKEYCEKDESKDAQLAVTFEEYGNLPGGPGTRTDLLGACEMVRAGARLRDVADTAPDIVAKFGRGLDRIRGLYQSAYREQPEVVYIWGVTRLGKTHFAKTQAVETFGQDEVYFKPAGKWWPLYDAQQVVIFDDFTSSAMPLAEWNNVFNHCPHYVQTKGGHVPVTFKEAYVTSNFPPTMLWPRVSEGRRASAIARITACCFVWKPAPDAPVNFHVHDPFKIPDIAKEWMQCMKPTEPDYLEIGARNHANQHCE